jgi:hypothetical protein
LVRLPVRVVVPTLALAFFFTLFPLAAGAASACCTSGIANSRATVAAHRRSTTREWDRNIGTSLDPGPDVSIGIVAKNLYYAST